MRRADRRVLLCALALFVCLCVWTRYHDRLEEIVPLAPIASVADASLERGGYLIDLNRCDASTLATLPGIGEVLAARIVEYRRDNGPFASVEALDDVPGIGEAKLAALRRFLIVQE